ncbi:MAG: hypothetical protein Q9224_003252 [Gallowayella concinna]
MAGLQEMQILKDGTHKSPDHTQMELEGHSSYDRDREELARLGKKQVLKLLTKRSGWLNVIGWQALAASGAYLVATIIQGLIVLNNPDYSPERWHGTLLLWAIICVAVLVNTVISSLLPKLECVILIIHILGFFAVMIPLVYMAPHGSASDVFTLFINEGGWKTNGLSFFVGLYGNVFAFLEIANASTNVPRSMLVSILLNGVLGFSMLIAVLFCVGNIEEIIETPTGYPFIAIFVQATRSIGGSTGMASIIVVLGICAVIAFVASASRMTWSFARDHGLPFWYYLSKVEPRSSIPLVSILTTVTISCLLALINIGSSIAFNDVISLTINGLYASYLLACSLLLYRRVTGSIALPTTNTYETNPKIVTEADNVSGQGIINLTWGPFHLRGALGIAVNAIGCVYMVIIIFFSFWPPVTPVTPETMNYSVLVTGSVILFSVVYYLVYARRIYKGPLMEI